MGALKGVVAAIQAKRSGLRDVVILEPTSRIGGLTTGGLGQTDIGAKWAFGGIAREFYLLQQFHRTVVYIVRHRFIFNECEGCCRFVGKSS